MTFAQHPLSAAFPSMSDADIDALADDIATHGQREPGVIYEGMVLDGWHRYQACQRAGVEFAHTQLPDTVDPVAFVLSRNAHRRHLTASQRAAAVALCLDWRGSGDRSFPGKELPMTTAEMAKTAGVSEHTVAQAKKAVKEGKGEAVRDGKISAKKAAGYDKPKFKKAKRSLTVAVVDSESRISELAHTVTELAEENTKLRDAVAVAVMPPDLQEDATQTIADLRARIKQLEAELEAVCASRDTLMRTNGEMKRQIASMQRQMKAAA